MRTHTARNNKRKTRPKVRINMRVDADLVDWVKQFAESQNTTMTDIVVGSMLEIRRRYGGAPPKVDQI